MTDPSDPNPYKPPQAQSAARTSSRDAETKRRWLFIVGAVVIPIASGVAFAGVCTTSAVMMADSYMSIPVFWPRCFGILAAAATAAPIFYLLRQRINRLRD